MTSKLSQIPDSALWFSLGIFLVISVKHVSHGLHTIRSLTEIRNPDRQPCTTSHILPSHPSAQEDAISTSSLSTLSSSPNVEIRDAATKILCRRFYASDYARKQLLRDLRSDDAEVQHKGRLACRLLAEHGVIGGSQLGLGREMAGGWRLQEPLVEHGDGEETELELRRRRREAVVIHDGERPIEEEDVFMRGG